MNDDLRKKADAAYREHEKKADIYFKTLFGQLNDKTYAALLTKDFSIWQKSHISQSTLPPLIRPGKRKPDNINFTSYIKWLKLTGKLDHYLERSIAYIYMRDLGKSLASQDTQEKIKSTVNQLKTQMTDSSDANEVKELDLFSMAGLYRLAQKEGIELTVIWLIDKLKKVSDYIPSGMNDTEAKRKLIKIIAGVVLHQLDEFDDQLPTDERSQKLDRAIRLGYAYGLTYPFIDDLLDSQVLSDQEKEQYTDFIRTTLLTGSVPEIEAWSGKHKTLIQYIHAELKAAFLYIKEKQSQATVDTFLEQAYVFFHSQEVDRNKNLANADYTNEALFIPIILKSASSRLIVRSVISAPQDEGFDDRTFYYGIYNQLADDFTDMFDDLAAGAVTPYTYYLTHHKDRPDLVNPFELYWAVISYLLHDVYQSDVQTREVILSRAINSQKRFKARLGKEKYNEIMEVLSFGDKEFSQLIQRMVQKADYVDFFDKLIRDHIITNHQQSQKEKDAFLNTIETARKSINAGLSIPTDEGDPAIQEPIIDAANFSLQSGGKRIRPLMTWFIGVKEFDLKETAIQPLLKSLEYMHTASLIFDDLPSQDNSPIRRGQPTVHRVYNTATAELTGLFLTQKAVEEQASLEAFDAIAVLRLINYSAKTITEMCKGQAMDLHAKEKLLTLDQLNTICFYKTGIAFEAALVMPAILADRPDAEIAALKKYAYHAGIAFQIKDDLLDAEGNLELLGKPAQRDQANQASTFVTVLGPDNAKKAMWEHYCLAAELIEQATYKTNFLKHFLNYTINREK
ncbi:polyprenyl synthetase family protein [Oceanobacillus sp. FSL H7-0719]|uniref:polyprenyl synthetase family protein n=1 Tax=Oceanobacillus sp. FSL H7-0719 TaxID=2954507 RepID=UPI00325142D8